MGVIFREYLEKILLSSSDAFHLRLIDPTTSNPDIAVSFSTPAADQSSPVLHMKILTPKFYYFALSHQGLNPLLLATFLDPATENRTAHVDDDTTTLIELLTRAATPPKQRKVNKSTNWVYISLLWVFWMMARVRLPFTGVAYPNFGTPVARARNNENRETENVSYDYEAHNGSYFLDDFVRDFHSPLDQIKYVVLGTGLLTRELVLNIFGGA
jgi:hypothetical protein